ncbi:MAG TPA: tetratricopeptide repeat protein, partial [Armatimonadota bacterium]
YQQIGQIEQAYVHLGLTCSLAPHDDYYLVRLACVAMATGRKDEAIRLLERACSLRPRDACYQFLLAEAFLQVGRQDMYEVHSRKAGRLDAYDEELVARRMAEWGTANPYAEPPARTISRAFVSSAARTYPDRVGPHRRTT